MFRNEDLSSLSGPEAKRDRRRTKKQPSPDSNESDVSITRSCSSGLPTARNSAEPAPLFGEQIVSLKSEVPCTVCFSEIDRFIHKCGPTELFQESPHTWHAGARQLATRLLTLERCSLGYMWAFEIVMNEAKDDSSLALCAIAFGLAYLADRFKTPKARRVRDVSFGKAIRATSSAISDPNICVKDEVSISILLLSLYNVSSIQINQHC